LWIKLVIPPSPQSLDRSFAKKSEKASKQSVCEPFLFLAVLDKMRKKAHKKPAFFSQILRAFGGPDFTGVSRGSTGSRCFASLREVA